MTTVPPPDTDADGAPVVDPPVEEPSLGRATTVITIWNLVSRATGFVRVMATASALGIAVLGDTYQRTNQVSNVLFELLAGGMLFSVLVPSFVDELRRDARDDARHLAGALATRAVVYLSVLVAAGMVFSRPIVEALTAGADPASRQAQVDLGTFLLWFILPQLLLYTVGSVASALLQADHRFAATSMAPALNNVVVTATMVAFIVMHDPARGLHLTLAEKVVLGGGTLAGTLAMTVVPLVALRLGGLGIRPRWRVPDADLSTLARRGLWGAGHVGLNELLVMATVVLAGWVDGGVIAYQTAFTFFLLPHALLAHPIFTARYPRLSREGARGDLVAFGQNLGQGLRSMLLLLLPASGVMAVAAVPALSVLKMGQLQTSGTRLVALVLGSYLIGLAGYSTFFLLTRASYALGDPRRPTMVNLGLTLSTVAGMVVATTVWDGTGLLMAFGIITSVCASVGSIVLYLGVRKATGAPVPVLGTIVRCGPAALVATAVAAALANVIGWAGPLHALAAAATAAVAGLGAYAAVLAVLRAPELAVVTATVGRVRGRTAA